jgi:Uma2 family endonuclease
MIATKTNYLEQVEQIPDGGFLIFNDVSWEDYEEFLDDVGEATGLRVSYDHGRMEVMSLSQKHEYIRMVWDHLVFVLSEELEMDIEPYGSTTMKRKRKRKGRESDHSYYIQNAPHFHSVAKIDLNDDPPPDLALEVDISHDSLGKFSIYAGLQIPEVWRYSDGEVKFFRLLGNDYAEIPASDAFPFLTPDIFAECIARAETDSQVKAVLAFRSWVKTHKPK